MESLRILVTGAGGPGAVNLCRSLLSMSPEPFVLGADASRWFVLLALAHERVVIPSASDTTAYVLALADLIRRYGIDLLLPANSLEIRVVAEHRDSLPVRTFLPSTRTLDLANSKWASHEVWHRAGLPVPETRLLATADDVRAAFACLRRDAETPVWVRGAGIPGKGIGVASLPCRTPEQAIQWVDYWRGFGGMIASEYLPGDDLTWMGLFDHGRLVASQGRRRLAYVIPHVSPSGITGAPAVSHTIHDPEVNDLGEEAARALDPGYHGVAFVDMKRDAGGRARVTELNAGRFGTTSFFYAAAGANFPEMACRLAMGEPVSSPVRDVLPADLYWIRTLDAGPVLTTREALDRGTLPSGEDALRWPRVPHAMDDFPARGPIVWDGPSERVPEPPLDGDAGTAGTAGTAGRGADPSSIR